MCELCKKHEDELYPDLGDGAFLEVENKKTWLSADPQQGIRIAQTRHVTYMGPEGAIERPETACVYVAWETLRPFILNLIAVEITRNHETPNP